MGRFASRLLIWLLVVTLVIFTATRIIDFLSVCFPPEQRWMEWPALCCFDLGTLAWLFFASWGAEGIPQRVLAHGMVILDLLGVMIATLADMLLYAQSSGSISGASLPQGFQTVAVVVVVSIIVLNFAGLVFIHQVDPSFRRRAAEQDARDHIHESSIEAIRSQARAIAPSVAREVAERWIREVLSDSRLPQHLLPAPAQETEQTAQNNGHVPQTKKK